MKTPTAVRGWADACPPRPKQHQTLRLGLGLTGLVTLTALPATSCLNRPIEPVKVNISSTIETRVTQAAVDKIDIVLALDNSSSMADKQELLAEAIPDLVGRLVNPLCVDMTGNLAPNQPPDPSAACAAGFEREFKPIGDINVGIVTSSLGGMGSDQCAVLPSNHDDDQGHLVARSANGTTVSYKGEGFLAWDPNHMRGGISDPTGLQDQLKDLVKGTGQDGCGYEQQLESVVRFLVDPAPYASLVKNGSNVVPTGTDMALLQQRAQFLRSDSLLAIVLLSDENDSSLNYLDQQAYLPWNSAPFYRASSVCATSPTDKCCYSCGLAAPAGCPAKSSDASCSINGGVYTAQQDGINLKPDQTKKKYGFEANFPVKRFVNAFTKPTIDPTQPDLLVSGSAKAVPNPIFSDLSNSGQPVRSADLVFFAAIVGVPNEAVAADPKDISKGVQDSDTLDHNNFWAQYVGDPDKYIPPTNPIMQESTAPRAGLPTAPIIPPTVAAPNGGERALDPNIPIDLQYTCIFQLKTPESTTVDCLMPDSSNNPLCTMSGGKPTTPQLYAKAYPGLRELAVVDGMQAQGIAASICPANSTQDTDKTTFGYTPAVGSIINRLKAKLNNPCLARPLVADPNGNVPCRIIEAMHLPNGQGDCSSPPGRQKMDPDDPAIAAALTDPLAPKGTAVWNRFCELDQLAGSPKPPKVGDAPSEKFQCQNDADADLPTMGLDGWCYIDAEATPQVGNAALVEKCLPSDKRELRFVGTGGAQIGATALITCSADNEQ